MAQQPRTGRPGRGRHLVELDILRGGSALYVAFFHTVALLTASGRHFNERGGALRMVVHGNLLGLAGYGFYAVLLFFVLSGFVVHLRQAQRPSERTTLGNWNWTARYAWRRAVRIYPPLVAALLATAGLGVLGFRHFPDLYGHVLAHPTGAYLVASKGTLKDALYVLVPLRGGSSYGADGSLWSIGYELWFYLAYVPILLVLVGRLRLRAGTLLACSVVVAGALTVVLDHAPQLFPARLVPLVVIAIYFPAWMAGLYLAELYTRQVVVRRPRIMAAAGGACIVLAATVSGKGQRPDFEAVWCLGICLLVAALVLRADRTTEPSRAQAWAAGPARWSYSLYLIHLPVIMFMYGALGRGTSVVTDPVTIVLVFLSTIPAGLLLYVLVERPSSRAAGRFPGLVERFATRKGDHGARPPAPQAGSEPLAVVGDRADGGR